MRGSQDALNDGNKVTTGNGRTGVEYNEENSRTVSYSILLFLLFRSEVDVGCGVGVTTDKERQQK